MADVPGRLGEVDTVVANSNGSVLDWEPSLFASCLAVADQLDTWRRSFRAEHPASPYWAVHSNAENPSDDNFESKLFPFSLDFEFLDTAVQYILFWAVTLEVLGSILRLYNHFFGQLDQPPTFEECLEYSTSQTVDTNCAMPNVYIPSNLKFSSILAIRAEADIVARYLCQSMEFCHRKDTGTVGPQSTCFAQWAIRSYFRTNIGYERELAWCLNIKNMRAHGSRFGIELMSFKDE
jgi:hypothetical protein